MPRKSSVQRNVALCYIRRSWVKDDKDLVSPEIQREHITRVCEEHGWQMQWFEDADGHRSGMYEKGRPGWLGLKDRMADKDVAAIVAYDLSRLHRRGWRIGQLFDFVDSYNVTLILASPHQNLDLSTPQGRMVAQNLAWADEWYAVSVSNSRKANILHRKGQGKTVGLPPFGTKRNSDGYLVSSNEGAWYLADKTHMPGHTDDEPPAQGAIWRSYYECAEQILELYVSGKGRATICKLLGDEGWAFRARNGLPVPLDVDDIVRVTRNWIEYGGIVLDGRAKDRKAYEISPENIVLNPDRAVFPVSLLYEVGRVAKDRSYRQPDRGRSPGNRVYPLSGLLFCAACNEAAEAQNNPALRSKLTGKTGRKSGAYRHRPGVYCTCQTRQVSSELVENDFLRLCKLLAIDEAVLPGLHFAVRDFLGVEQSDEQAVNERRETELARAQRRLEAAQHMYGDGDLERDEYLRRRKQIEQDITYWQSYTTESAKLSARLAVCMDAVTKVATLWEGSSDEDKRGLAESLFEEIIYDLDRQRLTAVRFKAWAEDYILIRGKLYLDEYEGLNPTDEVQIAPDRKQTPISTSDEATALLLSALYADGTPLERMRQRNEEIRRLYTAGMTKAAIVRQFGISERRVSQIVGE